MKNMTLILPTYNAAQFLRENISFWKRISKIVSLVIVEDGTKEAKEIAYEINAKYFWKENGNWGSVVNFAKHKKLVNTEFVAIVDPDDTINIKNLEKLLELQKVKKADLYISRYTKVNYITKKEKYIKKNANFIHQMWFSSELFYQTIDLPENMPHMDVYLVASLLERAEKTINVKYSIYNYYLNVAGQTAEIDEYFYKNKKKMDAINMIQKIRENVKNVGGDKNLEKYILMCENRNIFYIRQAYDVSKNIENLKTLESMYKMEKASMTIPFFQKLIWSKFFRFFMLKGIKWKK